MSNWLGELWRRLRFFISRKQFEHDLDEEMRLHRELRQQEYKELGIDPDSARYSAQRRFGNDTLLKDASREMWGWRTIENLLQDLRYGLRTLRNSPGFTAVAVLSLALGIGANSTLFTLVHTLLLRPLPYAQPDRLVALWDTRGQSAALDQGTTAPRNFVRLRQSNGSFADLALAQYIGFRLTDEREATQGLAMEVTPNLFAMVGVEASKGRTFATSDDSATDTHLVILSHGFWQRRFGNDPHVVGRMITLNGESYTVVGVMPQAFQFPPRIALTSDQATSCCELWVPLILESERLRAPGKNYFAYGRLKPNVSLAQAHSEVDALAPRLAEEYPDLNDHLVLHVDSLTDLATRHVRPTLLVLLGAVGIILLIACVNVANLLLARATTRSREIGIRAALGASRGRLLRQLLTESVLLGTMGGGAGLTLAWWGLNLLLHLVEVQSPYPVRLDGTIVAFTMVLALLTSLFFGSTSAWRTACADVRETLAEAGRAGAGGARLGRLRSVLIAAEVALSLVLLAGAGLLVRTLWTLLHVDPGFRAAHVLAMDVGLAGSKYPSGQRAAAVYTEILKRLGRLRGVVAVGATQRLPIVGQPYGESFQIEGRPMRTPGDLLPTQYRVVTPGYFNTMQIPLKQGRYLTEQDSVNSPCAVVVNQTFFRLYFSDSPVLGRRITLDDPREGPWCPVVGIVADVRHFGLAAELEPEVYVSYRRDPKRFMTLVLRTVGDPLRLASAARAEIRTFDKDLIPEHVVTMDQVIATSLSERWLILLLLGLLAGLALLLASVGLYGVVAYSVSRRSQELGIRAVLGASRSALMLLVLGETLQLVLAGIGAGLAAALPLTRLMQNLLYGVPATDPLTFIAVVALLVGITIAASYLPARRAARVDPMEALRYE